MAEALDKRRILWRYQPGMCQIIGLARAKLESVKKNVIVSRRRGRGRRARWSCVVVGSSRHISLEPGHVTWSKVFLDYVGLRKALRAS
jgi:hypothetical protein